MQITAVSWDWKDSINIHRLNEALYPYGACAVEIATGGDDYCVVIGPLGMTHEEAKEEYEKNA